MDTTDKAPNNKKKRAPSLPGQDLTMAIAFWIYGLMFSNFPGYAGIPSPWSWIFSFFAYGFYGLSILAAAVGLSNLTKSEFVKNVAFGLTFGFVAFLLHRWSESQNIIGWLSFVLKIVALAFAMACVLGIAIGVPYLWYGQPQSTDEETPSAIAVEERKSEKSRFEQIVSIVIAFLSLATAFAPLLKAWLNIP